MTDSRGNTPESRPYESLTPDEQQDVYDRAARDYLDMLRQMTVEEVKRHFLSVQNIRWYCQGRYDKVRVPRLRQTT